jgi:hypothetical protein
MGDVQARLTDWMSYQRYAGEFLVLPLGSVWFNLHFFPTYFVAFFVFMLG